MKIAVIVGAGLATRLYPISTVIPKVLVNTGQDTILKGLVRTYSDLGADRIISIVPSRFEGMVQAYLDQEGLECEVFTCDEPKGSAWAINTIKDDLVGHNIVFNWSDVLPEFIDFRWSQDTIYTYGDKCRFNYDGEKLQNLGRTGGNVVGVYQVAEFSGFSSPEGDFVDTYDLAGFQKSDLSGLVDVGDVEKLRTIQGSANRAFNRIEDHGDFIHKVALDDQGVTLQKREVEWYKASRDLGTMFTPGVLDYRPADHTLVLEKIHGSTLANAIQAGLINPTKAIKDLLGGDPPKTFKKSRDQAILDFRIEFLTKVELRNESIQGLIDQFLNIKVVNNQPLTPVDELIGRSFEYLTWSITEEDLEYRLIHGDLNFSNVLVDRNLNLSVIDPRGYFGTSELFGPAVYDRAKVLYALSGYDQFNSDPAYTGTWIEDDQMFINIIPLISKWEAGRPDREVLMVGIIWMALAGYFKNNPYKAITAYFYGQYLLTKFWRNRL